LDQTLGGDKLPLGKFQVYAHAKQAPLAFVFTGDHGKNGSMNMNNILILFLILFLSACTTMTPLTRATKGCNPSATKQLLAKGINVNEPSTGKWTGSPLHWALYSCDDEDAIKIISLLVEKGAALEVKDTNGDTPLLAAVSYNKPKSAIYLIGKGADIGATNGYGNSLVLDAVVCDDLELIKVLLNKTGNLNVQNREGFTPLINATINANTNTVKYLLDMGADPTYRDVYGKSALDYAISNKNKDKAFLLKMSENKPGFAERRTQPLARLKSIVGRVRDCMMPNSQDYAISVSNEDKANASINISGHITFTREAILAWDDDTLTFVAAHEIAHDKMGHVGKKVALSTGTTAAMVVANIFLPGVGLLNHALNPALVNNYSKLQEYDADKHGADACQRCFGITNEKQIEIMEHIRKTSKKEGGGFWASHPAWSSRIQNIKQ